MTMHEQLPIQGYQGTSVPHMLLRHPTPRQHIAIVFPGMGYPAAMPVL